jgi:hypothetical protein
MDEGTEQLVPHRQHGRIVAQGAGGVMPAVHMLADSLFQLLVRWPGLPAEIEATFLSFSVRARDGERGT